MTALLIVALVVAAVAAARGMWSPCGLSMLSSLNPVSERGRGNRFGLTVGWYVAGAATGGAALGVGCAIAAFGYGRLHLSSTWTWSLALAGAAVAVLSDSALTRPALPDHPRQVDERWLSRYRRWIYAGGYGVQIGSGFATYIMTAGVYLTALLAVLTGRPGAAFAVGLAFGVARGLGILVTAGVRTPDQLRRLIGRVDALDRVSLQVACGTAAAAGVVAAGFAAGPALALVVAVPLAGLTFARRLPPSPMIMTEGASQRPPRHDHREWWAADR
jgi:MFS family permease